MKNTLRNTVIALISLLCTASIYFVFYYTPVEGGTIFERRNRERYIEIAKNKEFEKLQVSVLARNRETGTQRLFKVEELGAKSEDVCWILYEFGTLTEDWLDKSIEEKAALETLATLAEGQQLALVHLRDQMSIERGATFSLLLVSIAPKRKWYHYLLL